MTFVNSPIAIVRDRGPTGSCILDVHDWIPAGTQGYYFSEAAGATNAPDNGLFLYRAWSSPTGSIRIEAQRYDSPSGLPYVKSRDVNGTWSEWCAPGVAPFTVRWETPGAYAHTVPASGLYECIVAGAGGPAVRTPSIVRGGQSGQIARKQVRFCAGDVVNMTVGLAFGISYMECLAPSWSGSALWVLGGGDGAAELWDATGDGDEIIRGVMGRETEGGEPASIRRESYFGTVTVLSGRGAPVGGRPGSGSAVIAFVRP